MAIPVRGTKAAGGTAFSTGVILASEVNTDLDNIVTSLSGNIDNTNVHTTAGIETTKIDGYSDSATERQTQTNPGTSSSASDATTLAGELERIRFKLKEIGTGQNTFRLDATAATDLVSWIDTPQIGPNLIRNGNFSVKTTAAGAAPDGWVLAGTPAICDITTSDASEGAGNVLVITSAGSASDGITQTLAGLKINTRYVIGCRMRLTNAAHHWRLVTTGAATGSFDDLDISHTGSTTFTTIAGVIQTDGTPADIVVKILANADATADALVLKHVWVRECGTDRLPMSNTPWAYHEDTAAVDANKYQLNTFIDSGLSVSVKAPSPGFVIEVKGSMDLSDAAGGTFVGELRENGVGVMTMGITVAATGFTKCNFDYVKPDPVPGTTYTYTVVGAGIGSAIGKNHTVTAAGETPIASWIRCRAVLESGGW